MTTLIFGCGYLGERVARRPRNLGKEVSVVTRSRQRADDLLRLGYAALVADITRPDSLGRLPVAETVLFAVGYDRSANQPASMEDVYVGGMRNVLAALGSDVGRFIYVSTTGVYGPAVGEWVDENTTPNPQREGGKASLAAEQLLVADSLGAKGIVLRLAGIYGPGRVPFLAELSGGQQIPARGSGYLNLIHVDDAADVVIAADTIALLANGPRVYCVSDGHPVKRDDYYREVARQIGAPPPQFVDPAPHSPRAARASADRRVRNDRMLAELRVKFSYPSYREGLAAILEPRSQHGKN